MIFYNKSELAVLETAMPFYDFEALSPSSGTSLVVKAPENQGVTRYGDVEQKNGTFSQYRRRERSLLRFLHQLFTYIPEDDCLVRKYEEAWVVRETEAPELAAFLRKEGVDRGVWAILAGKSDDLISRFVISALRYNSFIQLLFPATQLIITPTDHMDLFLDFAAPDPAVLHFLHTIGTRQADGSLVLTE